MLIALDAGHGGNDPGAVYGDRLEKDDNLALASAVGEILEKEGYDVVYTRTNDIYETPYKKATDANNANADYFISFHRNSGETPNTANGVQTLIYSEGGKKEELATNILDELVDLGFKDMGVIERPNLVVLKKTKMPAVLIETGFINNDKDNQKYDEELENIAQAIVDGIVKTIGKVKISESDNALASDICSCDKIYRVQVGAYKNRDNAQRLMAGLLADEFPAFIVYEDGLYRVNVGAFRNLDNAVIMEQRLRRYRYNTFITTK